MENIYRWRKQHSTDPIQSFPGNGNLKDRDKKVEQLRRENQRLKTEISFLKKGERVLRERPKVRYAAIHRSRDFAPLRWLCSAMNVSDSGYRSWLQRHEAPREQENRRLLTEVRASFEASQRTYGSPRVTKDLRALGYTINDKRVARLMREHGLQGVQRRRFRVTTQSGHNLPVMPNLLQRNFSVDDPNRVWVADITYIRTEEGWLYLGALMDLYSRRIVGWNTAEKIDRLLVLTALERALRSRRPEPGLIHHTDRGSQYAAYEYQQRLTKAQALAPRRREPTGVRNLC